MPLPSVEEINPIAEDLDGQCAVEHFYGKSLEEAEALFVENGIYYSGDLHWMGPIGFMFYFKAALAYLKNEASQGDSDFVSPVIGALEFRLTGEYNDFSDIRDGTDDYVEFFQYTLDHYDRYELDEHIYGDLRPKIQNLLNKLNG